MLIQKVARVALLLGLVLNCGILSASAAPILSIELRSVAVQPGQSFSLDVFMTDATDLFAFEFDLAFDPLILSAGSVTEGPFLPTGGATFFIPGFIDNTSGTIIFTSDTLIGPVPGINGAGTLATINFQALALGTSPITLSNVILLDSILADIPVSTVDGTVNVVPEPTTLFLFTSGLIVLLTYTWSRRKHTT